MESNNDLDEYSIIYITVPDVDTGKSIANELLTKQMVTFVNLIPSMITIYTTNNVIANNDDNQDNDNDNNTNNIAIDDKKEENIDSEVLMLAKIRKKFTTKIIDFINDLHPYDLPEIYALPIENISDPLRKYLNENLAKNLN